MKKKKLFDIGISTGEYDDFITQIIQLARGKQGGYVCVANVHMIIEAYNNSEFFKVVNNADMVTPDGKPLALMLKMLYGIKQSRVAGMDLLPDLLKIAESENIPVFFYGSTIDLIDKIRKKLSDQYSDLIVSGSICPPFNDISPALVKQHIDEINEKKPGIIFMILGCPKQEKLMAEMSPAVNGVMIGVGGAAPVFAGEIRRAPDWMQDHYLEWFFRLLQEPGRLWKRYLYTNTKFVFLAVRELIRKKIFKTGNSV